MEKFYVTTAIDYVNASPHIGHAYEKVAADVLARFHRMRGRDVYFLTGVDEHGSKVEKSAIAAGKTPQEFCDEMSAKFRDAWKSLNVNCDRFIRTTEQEHKDVVEEVFRRLVKKGDIYKSSYTGLYCEGCEDFVRERDLLEDGTCANHKKPPKPVSEENYFFRLSKYKPIIKDWIEKHPEFAQPEGRRKEVLNQLEDPEVTDFSVSRSRSSLKWGIPVPDDPDQVIYVWIDALTNYLTGGGGFDTPSDRKRYWPASLHLIGKDIIKFHCIYWPAMLLGCDMPLPERVYAHGFLTVDGQKISKSLGNVIDPVVLVDTYGADAVRFFLFAGTPFDGDGDFSRKLLPSRCNAALANNIGNLLNRSLTLIENNCGGKIPHAEPETLLRQQANDMHVHVGTLMESLQFARAIEHILAVVDEANKYMNDEKPWNLYSRKNDRVPSEDDIKRAEKCLFTVLEVVRRVAMNLYPFTPELSAKIWYQLGYDDDIGRIGDTMKEDGYFDMIPAGQKVRNQGPVFTRIEDPEEANTARSGAKK